jgi:NAD(P)-dependent dehydrogenase (short-subunit alcohol dehydrogenase family)
MLLENKIAVITGGNSGIGLATAELFLQNGARVVITGTDPVKLQRVQKYLGDNCISVPVDMTQLSDIDYLYQQIHLLFKRNFDCIVINAGISLMRPISQVTEKDFKYIFDVNVKGAFFTAQKAIPYLNTGASIIFIASLASKSARENFSVYSASKAAVVSLAKSFAAELAINNIRVNSISPGLINTPIYDSLGISEEDLSKFSQQIPLKRIGISREIASTALYLASDNSSYVTAADFAVDGGLSGVA